MACGVNYLTVLWRAESVKMNDKAPAHFGQSTYTGEPTLLQIVAAQELVDDLWVDRPPEA
jgi:hypothetical protein